MADRCCMEPDARHCVRLRPGRHDTSPWRLPKIFVPHYEEHCGCFSCRWVRETECRFLLSKTRHTLPPYPVANPTHDRVTQNERKRLLIHSPKRKFQIMYIYAMQLEDESWGWVVVPPIPLIPFLLTGEKYSGIVRFARHPKDGWFGLKADGQRVDIDQEMVPPLYNPFYQHYGYAPRCSPYRRYQDNVSGDEGNSSSDDDAASSDEKEAESSSENHPPPPTEAHGTSMSADRASPATETPGNAPLEAQTSSSTPPPDQSDSNNDESGNNESNNDQWVVIHPCCTNPPGTSGPCNGNCEGWCPHGKYHGQLYANHHANWWNTTIFVGGLDSRTSEEDLHHWFQGFGELMHVRKKRGETCGFVQYPDRGAAEMAMSQMQGYPIFGARLRLSWGKPEFHMDPKYVEYYRQSTFQAYWDYEDFMRRMARGEARRDNDVW